MVTRKTTTKKASAKAPAPKKPAATRKSATTTPRAKTRSTLVKLDYMKAVLGDEKHMQLKRALEEIIGKDVSELSVKLGDGLGPGGVRAGDGSWEGNIYKYRY